MGQIQFSYVAYYLPGVVLSPEDPRVSETVVSDQSLSQECGGGKGKTMTCKEMHYHMIKIYIFFKKEEITWKLESDVHARRIVPTMSSWILWSLIAGTWPERYRMLFLLGVKLKRNCTLLSQP